MKDLSSSSEGVTKKIAPLRASRKLYTFDLASTFSESSEHFWESKNDYVFFLGNLKSSSTPPDEMA